MDIALRILFISTLSIHIPTSLNCRDYISHGTVTKKKYHNTTAINNILYTPHANTYNTMSNDFWDYINELERRHELNSLKSTCTHDSNIISRILRGSKHIYLKIIDVMRNILFVETLLYYRGREQSATYFELFGVFIAINLGFIVVGAVSTYIYRNYMEWEFFHAQNSIRFDNIKMELFNRNALLKMLGILVHFCGVLPVVYFFYDTPYIVRSLLLLVNVLD